MDLQDQMKPVWPPAAVDRLLAEADEAVCTAERELARLKQLRRDLESYAERIALEEHYAP